MNSILFNGSNIFINDIYNISKGAKVTISDSPKYIDRINAGAEFLENILHKEGQVYGVTTGYGDSCDVGVEIDLTKELSKHLYTFHGCGTGRFLSKEQARAVLAVRLCSLSKGVSGVRYKLLKQLETLLNKDIIPLIPEEGSVGASGDLTPLSYVAACLCGERKSYYKNNVVNTEKAFLTENITPLILKPKEGLAIMNGTAVMTGLAVEAFCRARYLAKISTKITSLATISLGSNPQHFNEFLFSVKPHIGQQEIAKWIREDITNDTELFNSGKLQERYSIRCAPHIIGVLQDALPFFKQTIENEINSANDNPIINSDKETIHHGGHFYGGHIAFVMDSMKNTIANLSDLLDRQMALLVDIKYNNGLPRNLSGANKYLSISHGFKAVQIACSAWTAEALKLTMPASVFSRSTESHNQDKVSMGTISARDCLRILELSEQTAAALLMATTQAIRLRQKQGEINISKLNKSITNIINTIGVEFPLLENDRELDTTIINITNKIKSKFFELDYQ